MREFIKMSILAIIVSGSLSFLIVQMIEDENKAARVEKNMAECQHIFTYEYCERKIYGESND